MYKVGDKVKIRKDLIRGKLYHDEECVVREMLKYAGKATTITKIIGNDLYYLSCDYGEWHWPEKTLIPIEYTNADKIRAMNTDELAKYFCEKFCRGVGKDLILEWLQQKAE